MDLLNNVLLINSDNSIISTISPLKAIKLLLKKKAFIFSDISERKIFLDKKIKNYPSIIKMNYYVLLPIVSSFSKKIVFRRDGFICAYCQKRFLAKDLTIDHIIPKCQGGESSFENCITACKNCNQDKSNLSIQEFGINLAYSPIKPTTYFAVLPEQNSWNDDWIIYAL